MDFTQPWDYGDITFIVEGRRIYVNRTTLAMSSEVFRAMFTSDFKERKMTEILLPDKKFGDFLQLMQIVHPLSDTRIDDTNVQSLLHLAHEYQIHVVVERCEKVLVKQPPSIHNLILADKFSLPELRTSFFNHLRKVPYSELEQLEKEPEIKMVNKDTRLELIQYTLMFQEPSIENLFLAERHNVPEVYDKCMQYLKDTPWTSLQRESGFTKLVPQTLNEVLTHKFESLQTEVSYLTSWGTLEQQGSCFGTNYDHSKGEYSCCPECIKYRFEEIGKIMEKY